MYFDKNNVLNSEGRKILEEMLKYLIYEHPEYKPLASKTRKEPTLFNIIKLAEVFMSSEELEELLSHFKLLY